jgi:hypothetical protein
LSEAVSEGFLDRLGEGFYDVYAEEDYQCLRTLNIYGLGKAGNGAYTARRLLVDGSRAPGVPGRFHEKDIRQRLVTPLQRQERTAQSIGRTSTSANVNAMMTPLTSFIDLLNYA